jgi:3-methyladenine DNA glycosylase AlkD
VTPEAVIADLAAGGDPGKAAEMARYHKAERVYLGVANPVLNDVAKGLRHGLEVPERVALARGLWDSDVHEARVVAAKMLVQARIREDAAVWNLICSWVPQFDGWAVADHACEAGNRRIMADLTRLDVVEGWTTSDHLWTRRAALVITLPLTNANHPSPEERRARERVLGWAAEYVADPEWFIQKSVAWWLRDLSRHDGARVRDFLAEHGAGMKGFARKEAAKFL